MPRKNSRTVTASTLGVAYTTKPVSGWGGLILPFRFFERAGLRELLAQALPDGRTSPNRIPVVDMVWSLFALVLSGGQRFAHIERLRSDEVVRAVVGTRRIPSAMTLTRYFGGFVRSQVEHLSDLLWRWCAPWIRSPAEGEVLDLDSTVFQRYGQQEGSLRGYNPYKRGRPSHHPILAVLAHSKMVLHAWLRSGNTGTSRGAEAFLAETLERVPEAVEIRALRADSGFFVHRFLTTLEQQDLDYAVAARLNPRIKRALLGIEDWREFALGLEVGEMAYQTYKWPQPRRLIVVRERLKDRPDAAGRTLFEMPGYRFHALVTSLDDAPEEVWRFYNGRSDAENRIKELKQDFGLGGFCLQSFDGTEAVFRLICFLFNVLVVFKKQVLGGTREHLAQIRHRCLVVGGILGADGRKRLLRLGLRRRRKAQFVRWLERLAQLDLSTVMQLVKDLKNQALPPPRPWRSRYAGPPSDTRSLLQFSLN